MGVESVTEACLSGRLVKIEEPQRHPLGHHYHCGKLYRRELPEWSASLDTETARYCILAYAIAEYRRIIPRQQHWCRFNPNTEMLNDVTKTLMVDSGLVNERIDSSRCVGLCMLRTLAWAMPMTVSAAMLAVSSNQLPS